MQEAQTPGHGPNFLTIRADAAAVNFQNFKIGKFLTPGYATSILIYCPGIPARHHHFPTLS
jgi:hypothetical protein